jgi:quercetin dioxygenase-like cupin family protein
MISYRKGAYHNIDHETIAEKVRKEGFDPIMVHDGPGYVYPEHDHPETKLLVFLKGSMRVNVGDESFDCSPGDKLVIPGNTIHSAIAGEQGCTFFWSEKLVP